ncbi:MAG: hypothetical protein WDO73_25350 [Ignavibacteriota bacterium]
MTQYDPPDIDPTELRCKVCNGPYLLNEARVVKAMHTGSEADAELAKLCWVCARLRRSIDAEAAVERKTWEACA